MKKIEYKGYIISSNPNKLHEYEEKKFSVHGVVEDNRGKEVVDHYPEILEKIPERHWSHSTEEQADEVFVEYAKKFINREPPYDVQ